MSIERAENSLDGRLHIWKQKRIAQRTQPRSQKCFDFFTGRETFAHQKSRNTVRAADFAPRNRPVLKLFGGDNDPSTLHRLAYSQRTS